MSTGNSTEVAEIRAEVEVLFGIMQEAKRRLDVDMPKDGPVHPVSAFLTGQAVHVGRIHHLLGRLEQPSE